VPRAACGLTPKLVRRSGGAARSARASAYRSRRSSEFEEGKAIAETVRRVGYFYVTVPDAPGEGDRVLSALKESGVNLLACLGFPAGNGRSQLDLVADDVEAVRVALKGTDVTLSEVKHAFLVQGDDRAGAVADTTAELAGAGINVTAFGAVAGGSGRYGLILWVAPADYEKAAAALGA
jgi:hypothetical protein